MQSHTVADEREITGENPAGAYRGEIDAARQAWLAWGATPREPLGYRG